MSSSTTSILLAIFYFVIVLFATSDIKRFIFHVHIARVDRVPVEIDIDSSSTSVSLWYPVVIGIIFNIFILILSLTNLILILWRQNRPSQLFLSTLLLFLLFTIRFAINIAMTKTRDGLSTPTLVERSFLTASLSLEEELTTLILDWMIKLLAFVATFLLCYKQKQEQLMNVERREELKLLSNFE